MCPASQPTAPAAEQLNALQAPLVRRLIYLSQRAHEARLSSQVGFAILTALTLLIPLLATALNLGFMYGSDAMSAPGLVLITLVVVLLPVLLTLGYLKTAFRWAYRDTLTSLWTTDLPLVIADDVLLGLIVDIRGADRKVKLNLPVHSFDASIESKLHFAIRYYPALLIIARGRMPSKEDVDRVDQGCFPVALCFVMFGGVLFVPFFGLLAAGIVVTMAGVFVTERMQRRARLAAACDYFTGFYPVWLQGWACTERPRSSS